LPLGFAASKPRLQVGRHVGQVNRETVKSPRRPFFVQVDYFRSLLSGETCVKSG
jgi:hypothetical protein